MVALNKRIEVTLATQFDSIDLGEQIAVRVAEAAGFDAEEQHRIGMAVREGLINAYQYGNRQQQSKKIFLNFELAPDRLIVEVLDQGAGFDPRQIPDPLAEENLLKTSGRGIFLIRCFMDELDVQRGPQGGARLIMTKRYSSPTRSDLRPRPTPRNTVRD
jgi:serine/threonine-protein kinase RsbW